MKARKSIIRFLHNRILEIEKWENMEEIGEAIGFVLVDNTVEKSRLRSALIRELQELIAEFEGKADRKPYAKSTKRKKKTAATVETG